MIRRWLRRWLGIEQQQRDLALAHQYIREIAWEQLHSTGDQLLFKLQEALKDVHLDGHSTMPDDWYYGDDI